MTLLHWNPQGGVAFHRATNIPSPSFPRKGALATDVFEDEKRYMLSIDLPGVALNDASIEVYEGVLTVSGERKLDEADNQDGYRRVERSHGAFSRSFRLPKHIDDEQIDAKIDAGVLTITLPKIEAAQPRKIVINA